MKHLVLAASAALVLAPAPAGAQPSAAPDPGNLTRYSRGITARYDNIKRDIVEAAEAVPESEYRLQADARGPHLRRNHLPRRRLAELLLRRRRRREPRVRDAH